MKIKNYRNSQIELLRIISMIFIILGHLMGQGLITKSAKSMQMIIFTNVFGCGSRIAVNIFLIIGVYFMFDSKLKIKNIFRIWSQIFLYCVPVTIIMFIIKNATISQLITSFFPVLRRPMWFGSSYIILMLISPYLKKIFLLGKKHIQTLIIIGFITIPLICSTSAEMDTFLDSILWFIYIYICVGYYKTYSLKYKIKNNRIEILVIGILLYLILVFGKNITLIGLTNSFFAKIGMLSAQYLRDYKSIPNILIAMSIFAFFETGKKYNNGIINKIAQPTFAVYIIHQIPSFHNFLWFKIFRVELWNTTSLIPFYSVFVVICLFAFAFILEKIRINFIENQLMMCNLFKRIESKLEVNILE